MFKNDVVLITGASRGIGQAISDAFGKAGATVIGTATTDGGAENIGARMQEQGYTGQGMKLDVADQGSIDAVLAAIGEKYGAPTVLVNNAGITRDNLLMRMKDDEWDSIMQTNLSSVYRMSKSVLKAMMKARYGRIINIASVVGVSGNAGQTNYSAAKAGMIGFSKSLAQEVGSRGITVNSVAPGFIDTDMTRELSEKQRDAILSSVPLGRLGDPAEIASAVVFLASPGGAYITGETIHVNGGMYMN